MKLIYLDKALITIILFMFFLHSWLFLTDNPYNWRIVGKDVPNTVLKKHDFIITKDCRRDCFDDKEALFIFFSGNNRHVGVINKEKHPSCTFNFFSLSAGYSFCSDLIQIRSVILQEYRVPYAGIIWDALIFCYIIRIFFFILGWIFKVMFEDNPLAQ